MQTLINVFVLMDFMKRQMEVVFLVQVLVLHARILTFVLHVLQEHLKQIKIYAIAQMERFSQIHRPVIAKLVNKIVNFVIKMETAQYVLPHT